MAALGEIPAERTAAVAKDGSGTDASALGVTVQPVTPEIARQLDLKNPSGVVVTRVDPNGTAADAGVQRGDVIVEIDRKPVKSVGDFEKLLTHAGGKQVLMRVQRGGNAIYIAMVPPTK